jgi:broad specificity phosphatase PhoE
MRKITKGFIFILVLITLLAGCTPGQSSDPMESSKITIHLTRHGKTIFNTVDRVQGWADTPLTAEGIKVAEELARGLKIEGVKYDSIYTSDLGRTIETAEIIMSISEQKDMPINKLKGFREMYFGKYEGDFNAVMAGDVLKSLNLTSMSELSSLTFETVIDTISNNDETGEAETWAEYSARIKDALSHVVDVAKKNNEKTILVVAHGQTIGSILSMIDESILFRHVGNASISLIVYEDGEWSIESIGDMSFVEKGK